MVKELLHRALAILEQAAALRLGQKLGPARSNLSRD